MGTETDPDTVANDTLEFDDLVYQPTRLQLFASLYRHGPASFGELTDELELTKGTLSSHLTRMKDAGAVDVEKRLVDQRPRTTAELTDEGRTLFEEHVQVLETLLEGIENDEREGRGR